MVAFFGTTFFIHHLQLIYTENQVLHYDIRLILGIKKLNLILNKTYLNPTKSHKKEDFIVIMQIFHVIYSLFRQISFIALAAVKASSIYYDGESRPYEFGFRIEGNQHRHEKKGINNSSICNVFKLCYVLDINGIITGEFGFITADGTYHALFYETDNNGHFNLVSRRSSFKKGK